MAPRYTHLETLALLIQAIELILCMVLGLPLEVFIFAYVISLSQVVAVMYLEDHFKRG